jgi:hypothetical protein
MRGSCHCGKVAYHLDAEPTEAIECNCSICRRKSRRAARRGNAAGSRTSSASRGRSFRVVLVELLSDPDPKKSGRVMEAMMPMTKIDMAKLRQAYEG